jgi:glycosyltransferase involved in cell wall biosynthesis
MKLSIIIPCYNEARTVEALIERVLKSPIAEKEIILVDDCSTDGTRELVQTALCSRVDRVIHHEKNRGKGASIRSAIASVTGDVVVIQDADLEYDPNDYTALIEPILAGRTEVVYGTRFGRGPRKYTLHYLANHTITWLSNVMTGQVITDMETCYKVFRSDVLRRISIDEDGFGFEPEITAKVSGLGCRIVEVPISYSGRTREEGKKLNFKDAIRSAYCIFKYSRFTLGRT